ncbi:MAG: alpha/beta hydrolase-fold protein [Bacteroidota bacterium]
MFTRSLFPLLLLGLVVACTETNEPIATPFDQTHSFRDSIYSKTLGEQRFLQIYLPGGRRVIPEGSQYPVLYVLDPDAHFGSVVGMVERMSTNVGEERLPEMIVVGVENTDRVRDMFPIQEQDHFHEFLEQELLPYVEQKYATRPYRVLFGHSITGLRTIHTSIFYPSLFQAYIAIDPSLCHEYCRWWEKHQEAIRSFDLGKNHLFMAMAQTMGDQDTSAIRLDTSGRASHMNAMMDLAAWMTAKNGEAPAFNWQYYPEYSHSGVTLRASLDGLESIFSWYRNTSYEEIFADEISAEASLEAYLAHYQRVSEQLGYKEIPREDQVSTLVWYLQNVRQNPQKALLFAEMNARNYPQSQNAQNQMRELQRNFGD